MLEHKELVEWSGNREDFSCQTYTRDHCWSFEGGSRVEALARRSVMWLIPLRMMRRGLWTKNTE